MTLRDKLRRAVTWCTRVLGGAHPLATRGERGVNPYDLSSGDRLARLKVVVIEQRTEPVKMFVSLRDDRKEVGGGYRSLVTVMSDARLRGKLLAEALADLELWRQKYAALRELAPVFEAAAEVRRRTRHRHVPPTSNRRLPARA